MALIQYFIVVLTKKNQRLENIIFNRFVSKNALRMLSYILNQRLPNKESGKSRNMLPLLLIPVILAAAGGGWFFMQTKKKKQEAEKPDPDADYTDDDEEDYGAGDSYEEPVSTDDTADTDPYEDEILGDDDEDPEEI